MKKRVLSSDHYIACLLAGAAGDALGAPVEFMSLSQILKTYGNEGITGFVEFDGNRGEFTDDTQMALFTAEGLIEASGNYYASGDYSPASDGSVPEEEIRISVHRAYLRWLYTQSNNPPEEAVNDGLNAGSSRNHDVATGLQKGWLAGESLLYSRRAPGTTCLNALRSGIPGSVENPLNLSKGCGTIMRMAPVGLMFPGQPEKAFRIGVDLSALTHGHPAGYLSGGFFAALISALAAGTPLDTSIRHCIKILNLTDGKNETLMAVYRAISLADKVEHGFLTLDPTLNEKLGGGWVAEEALAISLFSAMLFKNDTRQRILFAVNHSGDSDSTGMITGNILGLINGLHSIPTPWIINLKGHEIVIRTAEELYKALRLT